MCNYELATRHRNDVALRLMEELRRQGFECRRSDLVGAVYIDLEGHNGFVLEVGREYTRVDRPPPNEFEYTGRAKIEYQGFGQAGGTDLIEPAEGFDLPRVVDSLALAIRESTRRREAFEAKRHEVVRRAQTVAAELAGAADVEGEAVLEAGEWKPRFNVCFDLLTEDEVRRVIASKEAVA